jgi:hypothetical protein
VLCSFLVSEFYTEVIDDQGEGDAIALMTKEASSGGLVVSMSSQVRNERVLRYFSGVREAIQAFDNLKQYSAIMNKLVKIIFVHDAGG